MKGANSFIFVIPIHYLQRYIKGVYVSFVNFHPEKLSERLLIIELACTTIEDHLEAGDRTALRLLDEGDVFCWIHKTGSEDYTHFLLFSYFMRRMNFVHPPSALSTHIVQP